MKEVFEMQNQDDIKCGLFFLSTFTLQQSGGFCLIGIDLVHFHSALPQDDQTGQCDTQQLPSRCVSAQNERCPERERAEGRRRKPPHWPQLKTWIHPIQQDCLPQQQRMDWHQIHTVFGFLEDFPTFSLFTSASFFLFLHKMVCDLCH